MSCRSSPEPYRPSRALRFATIAGAFLGALLAAFFGASLAMAAFNHAVGAGPQTLASATLGAPSALTATPSGDNVALSWSVGTLGTGYSLLGVANGSSSNCSSASFAALTTVNGLATVLYNDSRFTPQGTWYCYELKTSAGTNWTSSGSNPTAAVQLGLVATSVVAANGGTSGKLDQGDTLTITFNQPVTPGSGPSGTNTVCITGNNDTIMVGSTATSGSCATSETLNLGNLTGGTSSSNSRFNATYVWSNGNKTLKVTVGSLSNGSVSTLTGSWTFTPTTTATALLSSTGSAHICDINTGGGVCLPAMSGSF
jgi:hypothetical protein